MTGGARTCPRCLPVLPSHPGPTHRQRPPPTSAELAALRQLITEFREAVQVARRVDVLTLQPDCADPEKLRLEERVAELERRLDAIGVERRLAEVEAAGQ